MSLKLLEDNWDSIVKKVIEPLWRKFQKRYESAKMDKDDFYSLANEELTKAFITYNSNQSNIYTYATNVMKRKASTELRNSYRAKRVVNVLAESFEKQIDGENYCLGDIIEDKKDDDIHPLIMRYLDSLTGNQRRVAELLMQGHDNQSIKSVLNLSDGRFNMIYKRMRSERKVEPLKKLKGAYINER